MHADHSAAPMQALWAGNGHRAGIVACGKSSASFNAAPSSSATEVSTGFSMMGTGSASAVWRRQFFMFRSYACVPPYVIGDAMFPVIRCSCRITGRHAATQARPGCSLIRRLTKLPASACSLPHYKAPGRDTYDWETTVGAQRSGNIHVHDGVTEDEFYQMRTERDATLTMPRLILPSVQVNMRAGQLPPAEDNGVQYIKIPVNAL